MSLEEHQLSDDLFHLKKGHDSVRAGLHNIWISTIYKLYQIVLKHTLVLFPLSYQKEQTKPKIIFIKLNI